MKELSVMNDKDAVFQFLHDLTSEAILQVMYIGFLTSLPLPITRYTSIIQVG